VRCVRHAVDQPHEQRRHRDERERDVIGADTRDGGAELPPLTGGIVEAQLEVERSAEQALGHRDVRGREHAADTDVRDPSVLLLITRRDDDSALGRNARMLASFRSVGVDHKGNLARCVVGISAESAMIPGWPERS
jgi:hypothetical protein